MAEEDLAKLRNEEYSLRLKLNRLQREVYQQADPTTSAPLHDQLIEVEDKLLSLQEERMKLEAKKLQRGQIVNTSKDTKLLGPQTTGLDVQINLSMTHVPTSIAHLFDAEANPLVTCTIRNADSKAIRRLRVTSYIEHYSAQAIDTVELDPLQKHTFKQLPILFRERIDPVDELTQATVNVLVEDLGTQKEPRTVVELHKTKPIWLLARNAAVLAVEDPTSGEWKDVSRYFGAFVTPNAQPIMDMLGEVAKHHPEGKIVGYQRLVEHIAPDVESQVKAVYNTLKARDLRYVHSVTAFSHDQSSSVQRVRLPSESLRANEANCIDGTVLFASLLEGISLNPAIVVFPRHVLVGWETDYGNDDWRYVETTMIRSDSFEDACTSAEEQVKKYQMLREKKNNERYFQRWSLRQLRTEYAITPME